MELLNAINASHEQQPPLANQVCITQQEYILEINIIIYGSPSLHLNLELI